MAPRPRCPERGLGEVQRRSPSAERATEKARAGIDAFALEDHWFEVGDVGDRRRAPSGVIGEFHRPGAVGLQLELMGIGRNSEDHSAHPGRVDPREPDRPRGAGCRRTPGRRFHRRRPRPCAPGRRAGAGRRRPRRSRRRRPPASSIRGPGSTKKISSSPKCAWTGVDCFTRRDADAPRSPTRSHPAGSAEQVPVGANRADVEASRRAPRPSAPSQSCRARYRAFRARPGRDRMAPMELPERMTGGCQCGACRYEIEGPPLLAYVCHCLECRRQTGSAFAASMLVLSSEAFSVDGPVATWLRENENGPPLEASFCAQCGVRLFHHSVPHEAIVRVRREPSTTRRGSSRRPSSSRRAASRGAVGGGDATAASSPSAARAPMIMARSSRRGSGSRTRPSGPARNVRPEIPFAGAARQGRRPEGMRHAFRGSRTPHGGDRRAGFPAERFWPVH